MSFAEIEFKKKNPWIICVKPCAMNATPLRASQNECGVDSRTNHKETIFASARAGQPQCQALG